MDIETSIANYDLSISYAYHLHEARMYEKSYNQNRNVGNYASKIGDLDQAERSFRTAIDDAKELNNIDYEKDVLFQLTNNVLMLWGRYDEALTNYHNLAEYFSKVQSLKSKSEVLRQIGEIHARRRDNAAEAFKNFYDSLNISKLLKDQQGIARTLHEIGNVYRKQEKYDEAIQNYRQSLSIKEQLDDQEGIAITLHEIGNVYRKQGEDKNALGDYKKSLKISKNLNDKRGMARTLHEIGNVFKKQGKFSKAIDKYQKSLTLQTQIGNQIGMARSMHEIGNISRSLGKYKEALMWYERSLSIKRPLKVRYDIAITVMEIGSLFIDEGKYDERKYLEALPFTIEAHLLLENLNDPLDTRASADLDRLQKSLGAKEYKKQYDKIELQLVKRHHLGDASYHFR